MSYTCSVTTDLQLLSNYSLMASSLYMQYYNNEEIDCNNFTDEISIDFLKDETAYSAFIVELEKLLTENELLKQKDNLLYLYYLHFNDRIFDLIQEEEYPKQAIEYLKSLKKLFKMKLKIEQELTLQAERRSVSNNQPIENPLINPLSDLTLTLKSRSLGGVSINFDQPQILKEIWKTLEKTIIEAHTIKSANRFLAEAFRDKEITLPLLEQTHRKLRFKTGSFWNKAIAEFASLLLYFLDQHQIHQGEGRLSTKQAILIHELLHLFKFIDKEKIDSLEEDYIRALLNNHDLL